MSTHLPVKGASVLVAVVLAVLMVFVLPAGAVAAAPISPDSTPVGHWSYGAVKTVTVGPLRGADGWTYQGTATFGYTVTVYDNNTSANTFELTILRTMGAAFSVEFCLPSCSSPTDWVNLTYRAWEATTAFSNFTTKGTVLEGTTSVPAIALENSSAWVQANLTETSDEHLPLLGWTVDHTRYLSASVAGHAAVEFAPPLGIVPIDLIPGISWTSTSAFEASGDANYSIYYAAHGARGATIIGPVTGSISLASHGNVTVEGTYAPDSTIDLGGVTYPAISLTIIGPFSVREGVIFIPNSVDLFGSSNPSWAGNASGATTAQQATLDLKPLPSGGLDLAASSWKYNSISVNPADAASTNSAAAGLTPSIATSNPVSTTTVQGEPETDSQANSNQGCLLPPGIEFVAPALAPGRRGVGRRGRERRGPDRHRSGRPPAPSPASDLPERDALSARRRLLRSPCRCAGEARRPSSRRGRPARPPLVRGRRSTGERPDPPPRVGRHPIGPRSSWPTGAAGVPA
jgi:hypothetical protein